MEYHTAQLKCTKLTDDVHLPHLATPVSIGADVYAYLKSESGRPIKMGIGAGMTRMIPTGLVVISEPPYSVLVCSRSGMAARGVFVANAPGIIDPDYRGELKILLHNSGGETHWVEHGDRIAQLVLAPIPSPVITESEFDLRHLTSLRGEAGFGSTGR
jgi:dUTP pyrophosphatase